VVIDPCSPYLLAPAGVVGCHAAFSQLGPLVRVRLAVLRCPLGDKSVQLSVYRCIHHAPFFIGFSESDEAVIKRTSPLVVSPDVPTRSAPRKSRTRRWKPPITSLRPWSIVEGVDTWSYCYPYTLFLLLLPSFLLFLWNSLRRSIYTLYLTPYFPLE
jgi:hypothetical protein